MNMFLCQFVLILQGFVCVDRLEDGDSKMWMAVCYLLLVQYDRSVCRNRRGRSTGRQGSCELPRLTRFAKTHLTSVCKCWISDMESSLCFDILFNR